MSAGATAAVARRVGVIVRPEPVAGDRGTAVGHRRAGFPRHGVGVAVPGATVVRHPGVIVRPGPRMDEAARIIARCLAEKAPRRAG